MDYKDNKNRRDRTPNDEKRFSQVNSQEDFYELFRDWKYDSIPQSATETHKMLNKDINVQVSSDFKL